MSKSKDKNDQKRAERLNANKNNELKREKYDALRRNAMSGTLPTRTDLSFSDRLKYALLCLIHNYDTDEQIEATIGRSMKQLGRYIDGGDLPLSVLSKIAKYSRAPLAWLLENQDDYLAYPRGESSFSNFSFIPKLEVSASAGDGSIPSSETTQAMLAFSNVWLRDHNINPKTATTITARGDSMEPAIRDGDLLIIDTSISTPCDNGIYIIVINDMIFVKRIHLSLDGSITLISENDIYPPEKIKASDTENLRLAGRVMWHGRSI